MNNKIWLSKKNFNSVDLKIEYEIFKYFLNRKKYDINARIWIILNGKMKTGV